MSLSIDETINEYVAPFASAFNSFIFTDITVFESADQGAVNAPLILIWLLAAGVFFTCYLGFPNLRYFKHAIDLVRGKYDKKGSASTGDINRFQALATTLSGTVGLGNIAGVAIAISVGGPGAMVWMIVMGFIGMTTKFVESALGVKYRQKFSDGHISGGPMYYLEQGFKNTSFPWLGRIFAIFFAIAAVMGTIGAGNLFQVNQAYSQLVVVTGGDLSFWADKGWLFGILLGLLVASVILGGIKSIANVASRVVPAMGGIYILAAFIVVAMNYQNIPHALAEIFTYAFTFKAGFGGFLGAVIMGVQRGAFSNEAGFGSAAITHSMAQTDDHISQGFVAMLGPFIDTVVICTMTALVITISGVYENYDDTIAGVQLTSQAFADSISWFPYVLALTVFLFAFSTMISWSFYGVKAIMYLSNENPIARDVFKVFFCCVTVLGSTASLGAIIDLADAMIFAMCIPNIVGLYVMAREVKRDLVDYEKKLRTLR